MVESEYVAYLVARHPLIVHGGLIGDEEHSGTEWSDAVDAPNAAHIEPIDCTDLRRCDQSAVETFEEPAGIASTKIRERIRRRVHPVDGCNRELDVRWLPDGPDLVDDLLDGNDIAL